MRKRLKLVEFGVAVMIIASACAPATTPQSPSALLPTPPGAAPTPTAAQQSPAAPPTPMPTKAPEAAAPAAAAPKYGGTLHLAKLVESPDYDPHTSLGSKQPWAFVGQQLVHYEPDTGEPMPELAESWEYKDPTTLLLHIRKGVRFHNRPPVNGREFTADDVVWNIRRLMDANTRSPWRSRFEQVQDVVALDKYNVQIAFKNPFAPFLRLLADTKQGYLTMLPHEVVDKFGNFKDPNNMIGTGPFMLDKATYGVSVSVVRNPDYWVPRRPFMDRVDVSVIGDLATALAMYRTGNLDFGVAGMGSLTADQAKDLGRTHPKIIMNRVPQDAVLMLEMNLRKKPFDDLRVRRALNLVIDRNEALQINVGGEAGGFISGPLPWKQYAGYALSLEELRQMPGYRIDKTQDLADAKRLLAEAGYANGLTLDAQACECFANFNKTNMEVASQQLKKVGVNVNMKVIAPAPFLAADTSGDFSFRARGYLAGPEPHDQLYTRNSCTGSRNPGGYCNPIVDQLLDAEAQTLDQTKRKEIMRRVQEILLQDVPQIWLHVPIEVFPQQPWLKGLHPGPFYSWGQPAEWWIDK